MSALMLLVAVVASDHHDASVPTDDLAVVADLLDAGLDLHCIPPPPLGTVPRRRLSGGLLVAVDDATPGEVVRAQLDDDPVLREDPDVVLTHLPGAVREHLVRSE